MALREHYVIMCWGTLSYSGQGPSQLFRPIPVMLVMLVNCMEETTCGISISYVKQTHIHNTIHLVRERTSN